MRRPTDIITIVAWAVIVTLFTSGCATRSAYVLSREAAQRGVRVSYTVRF